VHAHKDLGGVLAPPPLPEMRTVHWVSRAKSQAFEFQGGLVDSMHSVHASTVRNAESAVATRVLRYQHGDGSLSQLPQPLPGHVSALGAMMSKMTRSARSHRPIPGPAFEQGQTTARKRVRMVRAGCSLKLVPLQQRDAAIKAFVKKEILKEGKPCRLIQPRDDRYLHTSARYIKPMEKQLYAAMDQYLDYKAVMKGLNGVERATELLAAWNLFCSPIAISLDFKKFDQHVRAAILRCEHAVYCAHTTDAGYLRGILEWQLKNRGKVVCADGLVKYEVDGGRMSGDPNTSLGNILICLAGHVLYAKQKGVRVRVLNDGDDSVIIMEAKDLDQYLGGLEEWWLGLGFRIGVDAISREFEGIDFCQCRPVQVDGVWTMVRNPATAIQKDLTSSSCFRTEKERGAWLTAVGTGGLSQYGGVPVFDALYRAMVRDGSPVTSNYQWLQELQRTQKYRQTGRRGGSVVVTPSSRVSFYVAFGITPDEQKLLEKRICRHRFTLEAPHHAIYLNRTPHIPATVLLKGR
jgi:hypothetical protein